jgi:hypothetical protein
MSKYALSYASQHATTNPQTAVHSATVHFFRPVFPERGPVAQKLHELSISTLSVKLFQEAPKMCALAVVTYVTSSKNEIENEGIDIASVSDFSLPRRPIARGE